MSEAELIFTALAELSTRQIAESVDATGLEENKAASKKGGGIAKQARDANSKTNGQERGNRAEFSSPEEEVGFTKHECCCGTSRHLVYELRRPRV